MPFKVPSFLVPIFLMRPASAWVLVNKVRLGAKTTSVVALMIGIISVDCNFFRMGTKASLGKKP